MRFSRMERVLIGFEQTVRPSDTTLDAHRLIEWFFGSSRTFRATLCRKTGCKYSDVDT